MMSKRQELPKWHAGEGVESCECFSTSAAPTQLGATTACPEESNARVSYLTSLPPLCVPQSMCHTAACMVFVKHQSNDSFLCLKPSDGFPMSLQILQDRFMPVFPTSCAAVTWAFSEQARAFPVLGCCTCCSLSLEDSSSSSFLIQRLSSRSFLSFPLRLHQVTLAYFPHNTGHL
uniref:Uncharacterized protein n=1 Tax=Pipistrellus kuhlii TaxID=59472 RepID=A0A7J7W356_PIPKU|nr:hypothetical protein mPipKuh1_008210 [Pipistrellus kuhlii]